jgi:phosphoglycerol transferase MdoB-like AlkP superfamily enzyme
MKKTAFRGIVFVVLLIFGQPLKLFADSIPVTQQQIIFKTKHASEVLLVWSVNNWQAPAPEYIPPGSYIKGVMAYSVMKKAAGDSFAITLNIKPGMYVHYMFWLAKDEKGKASENWDTFYDSNYSLFTKKVNATKVIVSTYDASYPYQVNIYEKAELISIIGAFLFIVFFILYYKKISAVPVSFLFTGTLISAFLVMLIIRMQINKLYSAPGLLFGAAVYDLVFLIFFGAAAIGLLGLSANKIYKKSIWGLLTLLLLVIVCIAIFNIEIVKNIGRPLNYQWLYYSGFLQSTDSKNALNSTLNSLMIKRIIFILSGMLLAGWAMGFVFYSNPVFQKNNKGIWLILPALFMLIGFIQIKNRKNDFKSAENPIAAFVSSWVNAGNTPRLFSMNVPDSVKTYVENFHQQLPVNDSSNYSSIKHVVLIVLESTPAEYVDIYNNRFGATPNIKKWQPFSRSFDNMYAHIPSTPASLFSLVSAVYPPISYRTAVVEKPAFPVSPVSVQLNKGEWNTAVFSAADLNFSNMQGYLKEQQFDTLIDFKNINCNRNDFDNNYDALNGVDDLCLFESFINWQSGHKKEKTFSIVWTMQTHHPYSFNGTEKEFVKNQVDLNRYLNALHHDDEAFGTLMEALKASNTLDETLVIVIGDHGEAFGRHNQFTHASNIYEENLHIPCIFINPVLFKGERDSRIGGLIDMAPTIAQIAGFRAPTEWQGRSLLSNQVKNRVFFFAPYSDFLFGTRVDNRKLIFNASNNSFQLFDLAKDPEEKINLASEYPEIVNREYPFIAAWAQYQNVKMNTWMKQ